MRPEAGEFRPGRKAGRRELGNLVPLVLLLAAIAWTHVPAFRLPFFADDYLFLDQVRGRGLLSALGSQDPLQNFWRPVGRQGYFWLVASLGESPAISHILNLLLFAGAIALYFVLVRRLAGHRVAALSTAILSLSYIADVPVRWASGSQDLIAVVGALASLVLMTSERRAAAATCLFLGLLGKETVLATPWVAAILLRRPEESWRSSLSRAWPLFLAAVACGVLWLVAMRGQAGGTLAFDPAGIVAAPAHLLQVVLGLEWSGPFRVSVTRLAPVIVPVILAILAARLAWGSDPAHGSVSTMANRPPAGWLGGAAWALSGVIPVMAVAHIWSAYYYLFAVCGTSLLIGIFLARRSQMLAMAVVLALAVGSQAARTSESFATSPGVWNSESHLNRFYFDRSMWWVERYLQDLLRQRPRLPEHSTLFFSGVRAYAGWQAGDGALIRWAYRDSTLHSYYFNEFTLGKVERGPVFVFLVRNDSLIEQSGTLAGVLAIASGQLLSERFDVARDAIRLGLRKSPDAAALHYWHAWLAAAVGDTSEFVAEITRAGCVPRGGQGPELRVARDALVARDSLLARSSLMEAVRRHATDPETHAMLSDLEQALFPNSSGAAMEALAARVLSPGEASAWLRWAHAQVLSGHVQEAYASLTRYFELAGPDRAGATGRERELLAWLERTLPGGELARLSLRERPAVRR